MALSSTVYQKVQWTHLLVRLKRSGSAIALTEANMRLCTRKHQQDDLARCHWILGRAATRRKQYEAAAQHLANTTENHLPPRSPGRGSPTRSSLF